MGFYIDPKNETKEEYLNREAIPISEDPIHLQNHLSEDKQNVLVCLVENPGFTAAAILYSAAELDAFLYPDGWWKDFYFLPVEKAKDWLYGQPIEGL